MALIVENIGQYRIMFCGDALDSMAQHLIVSGVEVCEISFIIMAVLEHSLDSNEWNLLAVYVTM